MNTNIPRHGKESRVRTPAVAGLFYPGIPSALSRNVEDLLSQAHVGKLKGTLRGIISPHAGYVYSGSTAAEGFALAKGGTYDGVIVVGPSHREYFDGVSIYGGSAYRTPLGDITLHGELREALASAWPEIAISDAGHRTEHSIEVQLPFLQKVLGPFSFVPVIMGDQRRELCDKLAEAITAACRGRNVLLVASSDLSHYHSYEEANRLDRRIIDALERYESEHLMRMLETDEVEACGGGPMVTVMKSSRALGARTSQVLYHCNSGDVSGEKNAVVGYVSAALLQES